MLSLRWFLQAGFALAVLLVGGVAHAQDAGVGDIAKLAGFVRWGGVLLSVVFVIGSNLALRFVAAAADNLSERFGNKRLLIQKIESFARFFVYLGTAVVVVALSFEINAQTLKFIAGGLALTIGFAVRDLLAAVAAGVTIMFDRPFQVGDRVHYAGQYGDITQIGLRSVQMRTLDDNIVTIPNNKIFTDVTSSGNYGNLDMQLQVDFYIGADQDLALAERLVKEAMLTSRYVFLEKPVVVRIKQEIVADMVAIKLRGKAYVLDTRYEKAFETDISKRVLLAFREHCVEGPASFERVPREHGSEDPASVQKSTP